MAKGSWLKTPWPGGRQAGSEEGRAASGGRNSFILGPTIGPWARMVPGHLPGAGETSYFGDQVSNFVGTGLQAEVTVTPFRSKTKPKE